MLKRNLRTFYLNAFMITVINQERSTQIIENLLYFGVRIVINTIVLAHRFLEFSCVCL